MFHVTKSEVSLNISAQLFVVFFLFLLVLPD